MGLPQFTEGSSCIALFITDAILSLFNIVVFIFKMNHCLTIFYIRFTSKYVNSIISSGFTDLSEKFNQPGKGGASKLSQVLNSYMGAMVQEILSHGGDILKFSGDAFLVLFKETSSVSMADATHRAIDTAIIIQKSFGAYETEVGVTLRVKIAISAGEVQFSLIGTESFSHYVVIGQPVWKVKIAEKVAEPGDIIVNFLGMAIVCKASVEN